MRHSFKASYLELVISNPPVDGSLVTAHSQLVQSNKEFSFQLQTPIWNEILYCNQELHIISIESQHRTIKKGTKF